MSWFPWGLLVFFSLNLVSVVIYFEEQSIHMICDFSSPGPICNGRIFSKSSCTFHDTTELNKIPREQTHRRRHDWLEFHVEFSWLGGWVTNSEEFSRLLQSGGNDRAKILLWFVSCLLHDCCIRLHFVQPPVNSCCDKNTQNQTFRHLNRFSSLCWWPNVFLPPANEVWGKVMFLQLSVHGGGRCLPLGLGVHTPLDTPWTHTHTPQPPPPTPPYGQQAGGTHHTGMLSFFSLYLISKWMFKRTPND